jgi:invasion protein IalB
MTDSKHLLPMVFALVVGLGATVTASAQGLPGGASSLNESHGDWIVGCSAPEGVARCAISQSQVGGTNRQRVLAIELTASKGGSAASGILVLPFGLRLASGVTLAVDDKAPLPALSFSTCLPAGCLVPLDFDTPTVAALRQGTVIAIKGTANDSGKEVAFSVSLSGFASALSRFAQLNGLKNPG